MGQTELTNTPYDDVFRTLLNDCSSLILPVLNEIFGESYRGTEAIAFSQNENFLNQQDGNQEKRITDCSFEVHGKEVKKYHLECQSSSDSSMLIRFFEYDTQIALGNGVLEKGVLTVTFPHSAVLFLRCRASTPERLEIKMVTPGGSIAYDVYVMKIQKYSLEEIFEKKLLFLIPFYIFSHESQFEKYEQDEGRLEKLKQEYREIRKRLEELQKEGEIDEYTKCTLIDMSNKVLEHIAEKFEAVKKGVKDVMGGKILDYEAKTIKNEGRKEGRKEGIETLVDSLRFLSISEETIEGQLIQRYHLTREEVKSFMKQRQ